MLTQAAFCICGGERLRVFDEVRLEREMSIGLGILAGVVTAVMSFRAIVLSSQLDEALDRDFAFVIVPASEASEAGRVMRRKVFAWLFVSCGVGLVVYAAIESL